VSIQPTDDPALRVTLAGLQAEAVDVWKLATSRSLDELAAGPLGEMISSSFRVMPLQSRSMKSVERLLAAGEAIIRRRRRIDTLTLKAVADSAGVTQQAAYRYFYDIEDLIRLAIRRVQVVEHERLLTFITAERFDSKTELASAAVAFVIQAYQILARVPPHMPGRIARDYCDICYEALWTISELTHAVMVERGDPCAAVNVMELTAGLTAVVVVAQSLLLRDLALLRQSDAQNVMLGVFLGALHRIAP
jgi:AcrR family transcriptional regulator